MDMLWQGKSGKTLKDGSEKVTSLTVLSAQS
jgi:hypothetical protein